MIFDNIRIAFAALRANKMRSVLTTLGIIIGVGAVIGVVSIVQGLNETISKQLEGMGATFIQVTPEFDRNNPTAAGRDVKLTYDDGQAILDEASAIAEYDPMLFRSGTVHYRDRQDDVTVTGVGPSHQEVANQWVARGRFFSAIDMERHAQVCLVGVDTAKNLGLGPNPIGKEITLGSMSLTVVGVMEKQGQMFGQNRDETVLVPITTAGDLYGPKALDQLLLAFQAKSADDVDLAKDQITQILRRRHHLAKDAPDDFEIQLQEELKKTVGTILGHGHRRGRRGGGDLAARGRHRDHEHHAGLGHRAHPRDRRAQGGGRPAQRHPGAVPGGGGGPLVLRRSHRDPPGVGPGGPRGEA